MPKLSVVIAVRNGSGMLAEAMRSVLGQTLKELELIIVNDASTEAGVEELALSLMRDDSRIRYINNEKHLGTGRSKEIGMRAATGDYVGFLDSDDVVLSADAYEVMVREADTYHCDAVLADHIRFRDNADVVSPPRNTANSGEVFLISGEEAFSYQIERLRKPFAFRIDWNAKIFRRDLFARHAYAFPPTVRAEGLMGCVYVRLAKTCALVDRPFFGMRIREESVSNSFNRRNIADFITVIQHLKTIFQDIGIWGDVSRKVINYVYYGLFNGNLLGMRTLSENEARAAQTALLDGLRGAPAVLNDFYLYLAMEQRKPERQAWMALCTGGDQALLEPLRATRMFYRKEAGTYFTSRAAYFPKKVSVIIPVSATKTPDAALHDLLASIERQTFGRKRIEIVVAGAGPGGDAAGHTGGATADGAVDIYIASNSRKIAWHEAEALNLAIRFASGEYIMFARPGDILDDDAVATLLGAVEEAEADFATSGIKRAEAQETRRDAAAPDSGAVPADAEFPCSGLLMKRSLGLRHELGATDTAPLLQMALLLDLLNYRKVRL